MKSLRSLKRLNRSDFWMWAVPLLIGHVALNLVTLSGGRGLGGLDTVIILWLAFRLAGRFYDIGWPAWIGPLFMIATMLVLPLAAVGYAIASNLPPAKVMGLLNTISEIVGPANLLLIIVAGSVPGRASAEVSDDAAEVLGEAELASRAPQPAALATPPSLERTYTSKTDIFAIAAGGVLALILAGLFVTRVLPGMRSNPASPPPLQVHLNNQRTESNGLTKETNDYLRQFSKQPPGWLKDSASRP